MPLSLRHESVRLHPGLQRPPHVHQLHRRPLHVVQEPQHVHRPQRLPRLLPLRAVHGLDDQGRGLPPDAQQERLEGSAMIAMSARPLYCADEWLTVCLGHPRPLPGLRHLQQLPIEPELRLVRRRVAHRPGRVPPRRRRRATQEALPLPLQL